MNVHPTKVEVRFRDGQRIYSQLLSTVRQTFLTSDLHARLQAPETFGGRRRAGPATAPAAERPRPRLRARRGRRPPPGGRLLVQPDAVGRLQDVPAARLRGRAGGRTTGRSGSRPRDRRAGRPCSTSSPRPDRRPTADPGARAAPTRRAGRATPRRSDGRRAVRRPAQGAPGPRQLPDRRDRRRHDGDRPARPPRADPVRGAEEAGRAGGRRVAAAARPRAGPPDAARPRRSSSSARSCGSSGSRSSRSAATRCSSRARRRCSRASPPTGSSATWPSTSGPGRPADPRRAARRPAAHDRLQGGREGGPEADPGGGRRAARAPPPRRRLAPLPARPADGPGLHQVGAGTPVRPDLNRPRRGHGGRAAPFRGGGAVRRKIRGCASSRAGSGRVGSRPGSGGWR